MSDYRPPAPEKLPETSRTVDVFDFLGADLGSEIARLIRKYGADLSAADHRTLEKIAYCESYNAQFDYQGEPLTSGTCDVGAFQVNCIHFEHAESLGLDVRESLEDNVRFAVGLYRAEGTQPWTASEYCWSKEVPSWD